jgi:hypothetical protein
MADLPLVTSNTAPPGVGVVAAGSIAGRTDGGRQTVARHPEPVDSAMSHIGFRCVVRQAGPSR